MTRIGNFYKKNMERFLPGYALLSLLSCFAINNVIYFGTQRLVAGAKHYDLSLPVDLQIPMRPGWIVVYWFCYLFWGVSYILISHLGKEKWYRFAAADMISRIICGFFFVFFPTTLVRPEIVGNGLLEQAMALLYQLDPPTNLFPSIHCLVSWFCYIGIRGESKIPGWIQRTVLLYCCLVFASVLFTRQHVIVDIFAGVALAQGCFILTHKTRVYEPIMHFFDKITALLLGAEYDE